MSDPLRNMKTRRLPPFPGSSAMALTDKSQVQRQSSTIVGGRPFTPESGATRGREGPFVDEVAIFLSSHPTFLDDYVVRNISISHIEEWLQKLQNTCSNTSLDKNENGSQVPKLQEKYMTSNILDLQEKLIDVVIHCADQLPILFELVNVIGSAIKADGLAFYSVQAGGMEIDLYVPHYDVPSKYELLPAGLVMEGTTLAAYVAKTSKAMFLQDVLYDDRFPRGVGIEENLLQSVICVPMTMPSRDIVGVMQFTKCWEKAAFTDADYQLAVAFASWFGNVLHLAQENDVLMKQSQLNDFLLEVSRVIFDDVIQLEVLSKKIMIYTKELLHAERCALFLMDEKKKELYTNFLDEGKTEDGKPVFRSDQEIRVPMSKGIVGLVAQTGEVVNIKDAYQDPRFNREIDMKTGFTTRNILCMPIISKAKVIGVIQMLNRKKGDCFTNADESAFKMFSVFCALALHYSKTYEDIRNTTAQLQVTIEQLSYHTICSDEEATSIVLSKPMLEPHEIPPDLDSFYFYADNEKLVAKLPYFYVYMVHDLLGPDCFDLSRLWHFTLTVRKNYRAVPYHNWNHGFSVSHCMYCMLKAIKDKGVFSVLQIGALMVATISHDVDHRGFNNAFISKQGNPLSMLYSTSVMEQHHYSHTVTILQQANHNIFERLSTADYKKVLKYIRFAILATDLALYFGNQKELGKIILTNSLDFSNNEHLDLVIAIMMTSADLVAVCKPFAIQEKNLECIYAEFYAQGDREKAMGLQPMPMMDRDNIQKRPQEQIGFIKFICQPCYQTITEVFQEFRPLLDGCVDNKLLWEAVIEDKSAKVWVPNKSVVINPTNHTKSPPEEKED